MQKFQSQIRATIQRLGAAAPLLPISLLLLLGFLLLGRGQISTLRAADNNTFFFPGIFGAGDPDDATGFVFRDYNANGARDAREPGVAGIVVSAYDDNGTRIGFATTAADGTYALFLPANEKYRLEFTGIPDYLQPGAVGSQTEATVAFITAPSSNVNVGLNNPGDYCQENPELGTPCYLFGDQRQDLPAVVSFHNQAGSTNPDDTYTPPGNSPYDDANNAVPGIQPHPVEAVVKDIGPTNGLAFQREANVIFAGAFMKRHSGFGPQGTGAIYRIDRSSGQATLYADLNAIFGAGTAGADPHNSSHLSNDTDILDFFLHDPSFDQVNKISLGDVEITEDEQYLYTVNLADRKLYRIPVLNEASPLFTTGDIDRFAMPTLPGCAPSDVRPFGLGTQDGVLYAGLVCSAQSTQQAADMHAYVYSFDGTNFSLLPVLDFPLDYPRGCADRDMNTGTDNCTTGANNKEADWNPWVGTFGDLLTKSGNAAPTPGRRIPIYPQPLLSDIEFANGYMIIGLRDRNGDLFGNGAFDPRDENGDPIGFEPGMSSPDNTYLSVTAGDMLTAAPNSSIPGRWTLEDNAAVGDLPPTGGANNGNGPGNGEYFFDESFAAVGFNFPRHDEAAQGGLSNIPGQGDALSTALNPVPIEDPVNYFDGGIIWLSGQDGTRSRSYRVFAGEEPHPPHDETDLLQGKNNGLGDLEVFCDAAPLEIGDRVWFDLDENGIQDPGEQPLAGVSVKLYAPDMTTLLATAVTNADGNYYFSNALAGPLSGDFAVYGVEGLLPHTSGYKLRIDLAQPAIFDFGYAPTLENADGQTDNDNKTDLRDSDAIDSGENAEIMFDTAGPGHNNHTLDFGFVMQPHVAVGNLVWLDDGAGGGTTGDGKVNGSETGIDNVEVQLYPGSGVSGTPIQTTTTAPNGCYLFDDLEPGDYIIHIPASQFTEVGPLLGFFSSSPEGGDTPVDDNADENGQNTLVNGGISSTIINLMVGAEPIDEPSRSLCFSTQPDANENMTVDFGFTPIPPLVAVGNLVWLDDGVGGGTTGDGKVNGSETGIDNVEVQLYPGSGVSGTPIQTTTTAPNGCYLFDDLEPDDYIIHIPASQFTEGNPLFGRVSSLPEGGDTPDDDNVDENGQNVPVNGGISSTIINLTIGGEPINEPSRSLCASTQPDANENMTVDFGFTPPEPAISLTKYTNGQDANEPTLPGVPIIAPGDLVTWTYEVTNSGTLPFDKQDVDVTDSKGETPLFDSELAGNGDDILDAGEVWLYKAMGTAGVVGPPQSSTSVPTLWGVDEQRNELFSVDDYTEIPNGAAAAGLTIYGSLYYTNQDGVTQDIGKHIGSFTIDTDNVAYVAYNKDLDQGGGLPALKAPVMLRFALEDASTVQNNVAEVVGSIPIPGFDISSAVDDNISGMSFDPLTGDLYALYRVTDGTTPDRLLLVSKTDASLIADLGEMRNDALGVIVEDGEAIEFDRFGNLFVSDHWDEHLYQIDSTTAQIISIVDNNELGGLTGSQLKTEGLAWDPLTDTMVASDDRNDLFYIQTLEDGNNMELGSLPGLLDVEAIDFLISCYMNVGNVTATYIENGLPAQVIDSDPSHYCN